ncbi:MAG: DUF348 domain-containing protein [Anaerolineales bacterium]|nr:DUF348 domain-containing protein [Anaerolineales bacterium]
MTHSQAEAVLPTASSGSRLSTLILGGILLGSLILAIMLWQLTARPVDITVDGLNERVTTHRTTVGDLLLDLGIQVGPHDTITPAPDSPIQAGMQLLVARARPTRIIADGQDRTVADVAPRRGWRWPTPGSGWIPTIWCWWTAWP